MFFVRIKVQTTISIRYQEASDAAAAYALAQHLHITVLDSDENAPPYILWVSSAGLSIQYRQHKPWRSDFLRASYRKRLLYEGKQQLLARACGLKKREPLTVLDATAGWGRDSLVLASLGCCVLMVERQSIIVALLRDALRRLQHDQAWGAHLHIDLHQADAIAYLQNLPETDYPHVIYLDPMHPERTKTALVKQEMRLLRDLVGNDVDSDALLHAALGHAKRRVVVKRPRLAPPLGNVPADIVYPARRVRFDVYLP